MKFGQKRALAVQAISALFILLFVYTATSKLLDYEHFNHALSRSPVLAGNLKILAPSLIIAEYTVSLLLLIPKTRLAGLYCSLVMMVGFTGYIGYMLLFVPHLPCSCGGVISSMSWRMHLVFDFAFTGLAWLGILLQKREDMPGWKPAPVTPVNKSSGK